MLRPAEAAGAAAAPQGEQQEACKPAAAEATIVLPAGREEGECVGAAGGRAGSELSEALELFLNFAIYKDV